MGGRRTEGRRCGLEHDLAVPPGRVGGLAGVFDAVAEEALAAYDKIIGLDLTEVAVDGSQHKAPQGGEGTGPNPR
jgi:hypothetical protein